MAVRDFVLGRPQRPLEETILTEIVANSLDSGATLVVAHTVVENTLIHYFPALLDPAAS